MEKRNIKAFGCVEGNSLGFFCKTITPSYFPLSNGLKPTMFIVALFAKLIFHDPNIPRIESRTNTLASSYLISVAFEIWLLPSQT